MAQHLAPTITPPAPADVTVRVMTNNVGAAESSFEGLFSSLFPGFVGGLSDSFGAFPLPNFLGLDLNVLEIGKSGNRWTLFADLNPTPQTHLANMTFTDQSEADHSTDSCCFNSYEWRHRNRKQVGATSATFRLAAVVGDDACCSVDDSEESGHAGGQIQFDVVPAPGQ